MRGPFTEGDTFFGAVGRAVINAGRPALVSASMVEHRFDNPRRNPKPVVHDRAAGSSQIVQSPTRKWVGCARRFSSREDLPIERNLAFAPIGEPAATEAEDQITRRTISLSASRLCLQGRARDRTQWNV